MYKEPRPYWTHKDIVSYECANDFEGPSDHFFILVFLFGYINLIYLRKYARKTKKLASGLLFGL